jgi:uncharacterized membrane protein YgdD (TMEM256/DUF423 family)
MRQWWIVAAGLNGLAAVTLGAAAQHDIWEIDPQRARLVEMAVRYGLPHAAALLALGALPVPARKLARGLVAAAGGSLAFGMTLFAGALYGLAAGAPSTLALVVPVGGSLMILGWGLLLAYGVALGRERKASAQEPPRQ